MSVLFTYAGQQRAAQNSQAELATTGINNPAIIADQGITNLRYVAQQAIRRPAGLARGRAFSPFENRSAIAAGKANAHPPRLMAMPRDRLRG
jgi:hypothetical protein